MNVFIRDFLFFFFCIKTKFCVFVKLSRASWEHASGLWVWCADQVGLCCRVLQCSCHLHTHHKEAQRLVPLPGSRHWLLTGQHAGTSCAQMFADICRECWACVFGNCRTSMWILKRWTGRPQRRRGFTFSPAVCHSIVCIPESEPCRNSRLERRLVWHWCEGISHLSSSI